MSGDNNWWRSLGQSYIHYTVNIPSKRGALNNGLKYPQEALYQLLSGSNRHIRAVDRYVLKIMNHIFEFKEPLLWMVYSASWECRVFMSRWNTHLRLLKLKKVIYGKMECLVRPLSLLLAVLYYIGKDFCFRGGKEHLDCYIHTENGSKNHSGSFM